MSLCPPRGLDTGPHSEKPPTLRLDIEPQLTNSLSSSAAVKRKGASAASPITWLASIRGPGPRVRARVKSSPSLAVRATRPGTTVLPAHALAPGALHSTSSSPQRHGAGQRAASSRQMRPLWVPLHTVRGWRHPQSVPKGVAVVAAVTMAECWIGSTSRRSVLMMVSTCRRSLRQSTRSTTTSTLQQVAAIAGTASL